MINRIKVADKVILHNESDLIMVGDGKEFNLVCDDLPSEPLVSPDNSRFIYISPAEWEELGELYLYDLETSQNKLLIGLSDMPEMDCVKKAIWCDDKNLLIIIGYSAGTVSVGGSLYHYNFDSNKLGVVLKRDYSVEVQDVSIDEEISKQLVKECCYRVDNFTQDMLNDLEARVIGVTQANWLEIDYHYINSTHLLNLNIYDEERKVLQSSLEEIKHFFSDFDEAPCNAIETSDLGEEGILISLLIEGNYGSIELDSIIESASKEDNPVKLVSLSQQRIHIGAEGGYESIVLFVAGAITQGATWDMIKSSYQSIPENLLLSHISDFLTFKSVKMRIADLAEVSPKVLNITYYTKEPESGKNIYKILETNTGRNIRAEFDKNNKLISFNYQ